MAIQIKQPFNLLFTCMHLQNIVKENFFYKKVNRLNLGLHKNYL